MSTLIAVLLPALLFPLGLLSLRGDPRVPDLLRCTGWPPELWCIAGGGLVATAAGIADWVYHRRGHRRISAGEHRAELCALSLGVPLFALMTAASLSEHPRQLLLPVMVVVMAMSGLIAHDETRYHRVCTRAETAFHRLLVGGHAIAFLAWSHWCFR